MKRKFLKQTYRDHNKDKNVLYKEVFCSVASINNQERIYLWEWCRSRNIDDGFIVQAVIYWIRIKNKVSVFFSLRNSNKELYMILCIQLSLKWHGYDEMYKCNFIHDLKEIYPDMTPDEHCRMEIEILNLLGWEL